MADLWGNIRIPIIMVSGPVNSGKTLFALTIDPNCRRQASEVKPTTLVYDQEGSADSYVGSLNFEWKDTRAAVAAGVHRQVVAAEMEDPRWLRMLKEKADVNDSPSASMFRAWYLSLIKIPPKQYTVGICDTFTPLQEGLIDWLKRHPEAFGRTVNEYTKASSMFLWPDVKSVLAHILSVDCRFRFETFIITLHMRNEWVAKVQTGRQIAEGLDVLEKLATLHLELDRTPKAKGKEAPRVPSAILKKERLVRFGKTSAEDEPILPPRLPEATPDAIRKYIVDPPNFLKLTVAERLPDSSLSDDQKLLIQQEVARNNAEAESAHLSAMEIARAAARPQTEAIEQAAQIPKPAFPPFHVTEANLTPGQLNEIMGLLRKLFASGKEAEDWLKEHHQIGHPSELLLSQVDGLLSVLYKMQADQAMPAEPAPAKPEQNDGMATQGQRDQIRELTTKFYGDGDPARDAQATWLKTLGFSSARSCTYSQTAGRILELQRLLNPPQIPEGETPF